ncbi:cytochrome P450 6j1-like [Anticarsia gemmatalis]|uniref:cytochrome P450 6j1-like n=1 Tax=Anticarsia gemmatalis TaxID=129554 RepID=UPI003F75D25F
MWSVVGYVLSVIICALYYLSTRHFHYWKKKQVPHLQPTPLLGNYGDFILLKTFVGNVTKRICEQFPSEPYVGAYFGTEPTLIVQDPELLKLILTKDFYYFNGREVSNYTEKEPTTRGIFFESGDKWKIIRQNLTPLFTSFKTKSMFPLIEKCTVDLENLLEYECKTSNVFELNRLMARYTLDCVGSCAFGVEPNTLQVNCDGNLFLSIAEDLFKKTDVRGYLNIARSVWPWVFYALGRRMFPQSIHDSMEVMITDVCNSRQNKPSSRNDYIDMLLGLKENDCMIGDGIKNSQQINDPQKVSLKLDMDVISAISLSFFGGGFETSATTLVLTLFEFAKNEEIQLKVQQEVDEYLVKRNFKLDYDCVTELPYLAACVNETLRLYPVFTVITREVMEDYTLPTGLKLDKGVRIHIPVYHLHLNPDNFPEPEQFRPERFMPEEKHKIKPYTYLPFGEGPRACIGVRFSKMEVYTGIITVLKNYKLKLAKGMSKTIDFDPRIIVSHTTEGVYLEFERRQTASQNA